MSLHRKNHNQRNLAMNGREAARKFRINSKPETASTEEMQRFYKSIDWRKLRYGILVMYGRKCMCCGQSDGVMHVDHIKPLRFYWGLRLDANNLQVLCEPCNHGKSNSSWTDFRPKAENAVPWK